MLDSYQKLSEQIVRECRETPVCVGGDKCSYAVAKDDAVTLKEYLFAIYLRIEAITKRVAEQNPGLIDQIMDDPVFNHRYYQLLSVRGADAKRIPPKSLTALNYMLYEDLVNDLTGAPEEAQLFQVLP